MRKPKRGGDDLTGRFLKNRGPHKKNLVSGRLLEECNGDVWSGGQKWSKSVASITLCNGDEILFSCSGIATEHQGRHQTRFLTTASLVKVLDAKSKDHYHLKIQVRHEGTEVYSGFVGEYDLDHNFAVVDVHTFLDVQVGPFQRALESLPDGEVLALGRDVSGELVTRIVELNGDTRLFEDDDVPDCKISEAWEGGPLLSFDGNMVGMNLFLIRRRAVFLPWGTILKHYWTSQQRNIGPAESKKLKVYRFGARPIGENSNSHPEVHGDCLKQEQLDLDSMGYPKLPSTMLVAGMILVNTFEETFGDIHGKGVWRKFSKGTSNINRNVVALASFCGEKRFFACTGFFIKWNGSMVILTSASLVRNSGDEDNTVDKLRIQVLLNNQVKEGKLEHCNLHYNIALVSVKDCHAPRPLNILLHQNLSSKVAAVGRCFKSGKLMATGGQLVSWTGTLDCKFLVRSSCKITKAGIGGPVVNLDGDVIGMNFYDTRIGTPFLLLADIFEILALLEIKSGLGEVGNTPDSYFCKIPHDDTKMLNRWPVPIPCWRHSEEVGDEDDQLLDSKSGRLKYNFINGVKSKRC